MDKPQHIIFVYKSGPCNLSYKRKELDTLCEHMSFVVGSVLLIFYVFCVVIVYVFTFCVVTSATISAYKLWSVRLYLRLFVGGFMSYLRYLCGLHSGVQQRLCSCFSYLRLVSCVPNVASFSVPSIVFYCPFGIL